jgi:hypothetical protein
MLRVSIWNAGPLQKERFLTGQAVRRELRFTVSFRDEML